jgi:hypothetical protein
MGEGEHFLKMLHATADVLLKPGRETALRTWVALARRADFNTGGGVFVSYKRLKEDHGISRDSIAKGLRELEELGLIERQRRFNKSTVFTVLGLHLQSATPTGTSRNQSATPTTPVGNADSSGREYGLQRSALSDTNERPVTRDHSTRGGQPAPDARGPGRPNPTGNPTKGGDAHRERLLREEAKADAAIARMPDDERNALREDVRKALGDGPYVDDKAIRAGMRARVLSAAAKESA